MRITAVCKSPLTPHPSMYNYVQIQRWEISTIWCLASEADKPSGLRRHPDPSPPANTRTEGAWRSTYNCQEEATRSTTASSRQMHCHACHRVPSLGAGVRHFGSQPTRL